MDSLFTHTPKITLKTLLILVLLFSGRQAAQAQTGPKAATSIPPLLLNWKGADNLTPVNAAYYAQDKVLSNRLFDGKYYLLLRFSELPTQNQVKLLNKSGISLLGFVPEKAYHAAIPAGISADDIQAAGITDMLSLPAEARLDEGLTELSNSPASTPVKVSFFLPQGVSFKQAMALVGKVGGNLVKDHNPHLTVNVPANKLKDFAASAPWSLIESAEGELVPFNYPSATNTRANVLAGRYAGSRNLSGAGVMVGVGDGGHLTPHYDYQDRVTNTNQSNIPSYGDHCDHVAGTVGGAGLLNPDEKGMAWACNMVTAFSSDIIWHGTDLHTRLKMILTNNSYGQTLACSTSGNYTTISQYIDNQLRDYPKLLHVFAAGNDGRSTCGSYPAGYSTMSQAYGSSKNLLTVGACDDTDSIAVFSSRGPCRDGRLKPEIVTNGVATNSTVPTNSYGVKQGTSMACPAAVGSIALLVERYRQLNTGQDADASLLKALVCNTADDKGNAHADFKFGYGRLNVRRAVIAMEQGRYIQGSVSNAGTNTHTITVPSGTAQLRVLICWTDREASGSFSPVLVNNLNLTVTDPASVTYNPWVLNTTPALVASSATRGVDNLNNNEQVTIDNPAAGTYSVKVNGFSVPYGPQSYYIAYEFMSPGITLCHPVGGETFTGGLTQRVIWDKFAVTSGTFGIDYSTNNGSTWTAITSGLAAGTSYYDWSVPSGIAVNAILRVTHSGGLATTQSTGTFSIMNQLNISGTACDRSVYLTWGAVTGATQYTVYVAQNNKMDSITTVSGTAYTLNQLINGNAYFVSVRPKSASVIGRRCNAVSYTPTAGTVCGSTNDIGIGALVSPATLFPRENTSTALSAATVITCKVKNFGTNSVTLTGQTVSYRINRGTINTATLTAVMASNTYSTVTFAATADMHNTGDYLLELWTALSGDNNPYNDTLRQTLHFIANPAVSLPVTETFEAMPEINYTAAVTGFAGSERWDFRNSSSSARLRNNVFSDLNLTGSGLHTLTLDRNAVAGTAVADTLFYTLNLSGYTGATALTLDFDYMQHTETADDAAKRVWARGSDAQPWVQVYDLYANMAAAGTVKQVRQLNLIPLLGGQAITTSFQLRFGWGGTNYAYDPADFGGFSFDNITLSAPGSDVSLLSIDAPLSSCNPSAAAAVTVKVKNNSAAALTNVPVKYSLNFGTAVAGTVPSVPAGATVSFTFPTTINLTGIGAYNLTAYTDLPADGYKQNDTVKNQAVVSYGAATFPYLDNFESGNGGWATYGTKSSWAYGTIQNKVIITAAASGSKCWVTGLNSNYNTNETSYLESPCFDLSGLSSNPTFGFSRIALLESGYDFNWVEYSTDGGSTWTKLGQNGTGTKWYNNTSKQAWDGLYWVWATASNTLPVTTMADKSRVKIRLVFTSDEASEYDGVGVDDVSLYFPATLAVSGVSAVSPYCTGGTLNVGYTATGSFFSGNTYTVQLSDASGSFTNAVTIGTVTASVSGTLACTVPANTPAGTGYRVRMVSSSPVITTSDNGANLTINITPSAPTASNNAPLSGATLSLTAGSVAGATAYTWSGPGSFSATGQTVTRSNFSQSMAGTYSVKATVGGCQSPAGTTSVSYIFPSITWTGAVSSAWADANNWNPSQTPDANTDMNVLAGAPNMPVISGNANANSVNIAAGASLSLSGPAASLTLLSGFSNAGTFNGTAGSVTMAGTAQQSFSGNFNLGNVTINNSAGVNAGTGTLSVSGILKLQAGNFRVSNATVKLLSTASGSASLAKLETGASLTGNLTVQRYIPGGSAHNIGLAAPVKGQTLQALQASMTVFGQFPGGNASRGSSVYYYDPTYPNTNGYYKPSAITDSLQTGRGIMLWAAADLFTQGATFSFTGPPKTGNALINLSYCTSNCAYASPNGWNLIGNPYPCAIDWHTVTKTGLSPQFHVWSNTQYASYSQGTGIGINGGGRYIAAGQSFFTLATAAGSQVLITESQKVTGQPENYMRTEAADNVLRIKLTDGSGYSDEAALRFMAGGGNRYNPDLCALKRPGTLLNLGILDKDFQNISIMARPELQSVDSIPLSIAAADAGIYAVSVSGTGSFAQTPQLALFDRYLNTFTPVSENEPKLVTITSDSGSFKQGRLVLLVNPGTVSGTAALAAKSPKVQIYPNPGTGLFTLQISQLQSEAGKLLIYNALGQQVSEQVIPATNAPFLLDLRHLPNGVYHAELLYNGLVLRQKLVKQQ